MYYPNLFAGVRPYNSLRDRVDNPLDLSVKQSIRPEAPELLMDRKLSMAGISHRPLTQQMPLLDTMYKQYAYESYLGDSSTCAMTGPTNALIGQTLTNPYCPPVSSNSGVGHLGLIPDLLQQNRDSLAMEAAAVGASTLTPYTVDVSGLPYHMRIGSASAALALNSANQRAFYGHNSMNPVIPPHLTASFGSTIPHFPIYTDLFNDITRRPIETDKSIFGSLASMQSMHSPAEPTTHFSEHLQRLRDHSIHQNKCNSLCCPQMATSGQSSTNMCNCCNNNNNNITKLQSKDVCNQTKSQKFSDISCAQNNSNCDLKSHFEKKVPQIVNIKCAANETTNSDLWKFKCSSKMDYNDTKLDTKIDAKLDNHQNTKLDNYIPQVITIDEDCNNDFIDNNDIQIKDFKVKQSLSLNLQLSYRSKCDKNSEYSCKPSLNEKNVKLTQVTNTCQQNQLNSSDSKHNNRKNHGIQAILDNTKQEAVPQCTDHQQQQHSTNNSAIKLKEFKILNKNQNVLTKDKKVTKETKTVEVQCDGPDWTPIVLPNQLKNKLHKVISDLNNCSNGSIKVIKKKKKCKQKHNHNHNNHRKQCRSRSPSSTSSIISSQELNDAMDCLLDNNDSNNSKYKKRSMLKCLINSDGYVADKIKKNSGQHDLFVSDPSQLGREERALQRAIKHFEEKVNKQEKGLKDRSEETLDYNSNSESENESNKYQKTIESVVIESRKRAQYLESTTYSHKNSKESLENQLSQHSIHSNNKTDETQSKDKQKHKKRTFSKVMEDKSQSDVKCHQKKIKLKHKNIEPNGQQNECKQKKALVSVRRRRFRSGLDMIRNPYKRKKPKIATNIISSMSSNKRIDRSNGSVIDERQHKSNCESTTPSTAEVKRLIVNKALGETLLHRAARSNRLDVVISCLQSITCDVNARDNANYTPLHECCTRGNLEVAALLLRNGAHVDASATGGIRPLHDAIENNHIEVVRLLLAYGADPKISTYSGATPLQLARSKAMTTFLTGFLDDISSDDQLRHGNGMCGLQWKFGSTLQLSDKQMAYNLFEDLPSDDDESYDFLFEVSDCPLDAIYRLRHSKDSKQYMRLSDVLKKARISRDEMIGKHPNIEITSLVSHNLQNTNITHFVVDEDVDDDNVQDFVVYNDYIKNILSIQTIKL
ncbi:general transcriptional corepressor trfA-like isoform X2 [Oppia nitens]|uniref:general transcriptional corepressor trfA-like isoform X2 n=1 Tax=Oppia nitens TaxID=1686743 RepID=UPI0023DC7151|nr:general transcriptional corepressor trfA-like isoform X2 [Oppia nitens]